MRSMRWRTVAAAMLVGIVAIGAPGMAAVEEARHVRVDGDGAFEIRDYAAMVVAETLVEGDRDRAINRGFRAIADYIFGNNRRETTIAMTAPVLQQGESIAMTVPVTQEPLAADGAPRWRVSFVMPAGSSLDALPAPNNPAVRLREIAPRRFATVRFSGIAWQSSLDEQTAKLRDWMQARGLAALGAPTYAFYNPPWTLPFLRRNEVLIEIARPAP